MHIGPGLTLAIGFAALAILFHRSLIEPVSIQLGASVLALLVGLGFVSIFPMEAEWYGAWTGATIHAVPTVAAAAFDHSDQAGQTATLVKLMRVAMLAPLVFGLALMRGRSQKKKGGTQIDNPLQLIPFFV